MAEEVRGVSGRDELWALINPGGGHHGAYILHADSSCCGGRGALRRQVRDFVNPSYFDGDEFELCPAAQAAGYGERGKDRG